MWDHLWASGEQPAEYYELQVCRLYHCTPNIAAKIPLAKVLAHAICANVETEVHKVRNA